VSPHLDQTGLRANITRRHARTTAHHDLGALLDPCESSVLALVERISPPFPRITGPPSAFAVSNCFLWPLRPFMARPPLPASFHSRCKVRVKVRFRTSARANHAPFRARVESFFALSTEFDSLGQPQMSSTPIGYRFRASGRFRRHTCQRIVRCIEVMSFTRMLRSRPWPRELAKFGTSSRELFE
jgi:hypothetical protein